MTEDAEKAGFGPIGRMLVDPRELGGKDHQGVAVGITRNGEQALYIAEPRWREPASQSLESLVFQQGLREVADRGVEGMACPIDRAGAN